MFMEHWPYARHCVQKYDYAPFEISTFIGKHRENSWKEITDNGEGPEEKGESEKEKKRRTERMRETELMWESQNY